MAIACYKYGLTLDEALHLTFPQLHMLEQNLIKILKAENGDEAGVKADGTQTTSSERENAEYNTEVGLPTTISWLAARCGGRLTYTDGELQNPLQTVKNYQSALKTKV